MPLHDVRGLVREHACKLGLVVTREDRAVIAADEAARKRKGVDRAVAHDEVGEVPVCIGSLRRKARAD